jgi:hypothetical protein
VVAATGARGARGVRWSVVEQDGSEGEGGAELDGSEPDGGAERSKSPWESFEPGPQDRSWVPERARRLLESDRTLYWTASAPGCPSSGPFEVGPRFWSVDILKRWVEGYRDRYDCVGPIRLRVRGGTPKRDLDTFDVIPPEPEPEPSRLESLLERVLSDPQATGRALRVMVAEVGPGIREALGVGVGELLDVVAESSAAKVIEKLKAEEGF